MTTYNLKHFTGSKTPQQKKKIIEAVTILDALGIPFENYTQRQWRRVERLGLVLLALGDIKPSSSWSKLKSKNDEISLTTRGIIDFINKYYGENISRGSYDDFKRKELDLLLADSIVIPGFVERSAVNDSRSGYAICPVHANAIRKFGTNLWKNSVANILRQKVTLRETLDTSRNLSMISVVLPHGTQLSLTSGKHNELQKAIIEKFLPRYGYGCEILYVGDSSDKYLFINKQQLLSLNFPEPNHEELPDIIAFSEQKNWIYLIEAVTSFGEISPIRKVELEKLVINCDFPVVYVTAFLNRETYRKYCANLAWETEVWIADDPRVIGFLCKSGFWEREIRCSSRSNHDFEITPMTQTI